MCTSLNHDGNYGTVSISGCFFPCGCHGPRSEKNPSTCEVPHGVMRMLQDAHVGNFQNFHWLMFIGDYHNPLQVPWEITHILLRKLVSVKGTSWIAQLLEDSAIFFCSLARGPNDVPVLPLLWYGAGAAVWTSGHEKRWVHLGPSVLTES